jgi:uncharacterized membrane protein YhaH (DUF805 family)
MTSTTVIVLTIIGTGILCYLMTCWALMDVAGRDFGDMGKKALWGAVAFIPFAGWMVYLLCGRKRGKRREEPSGGT